MKLCRVGEAGNERPAMIDAEGGIRDLSGHVGDIDSGAISSDALSRLAQIDPASLPLIEGPVRYGPCVGGTRQFVAIGLNYADHAAESNLPIPEEPVVFNKWVSCIQGPNDPVTIPRASRKTDWEVELGVIIGTEAYHVDEASALDHVAGYCVVNDVSEREWQQERGATWDKGKGFPGFGPIGPWLVTADEVGDPQALGMWLEVNGKRVQDGSSSTMIFTVAQIVSYLSQFMTLLPGDVITTGTPPGVGLGQKPEPWYLKAGDVVTLGIEKLGTQRQEFVAID
ncbi:2-keto-4-pentenoate hydratase/2-oxohepta-3-ene-1,7-dioic acid hydratase in catechol pathway [Novosphingobium sp. PhB55]|uniref:fumarylacetoacetate hydrolase family protein n=1 Tax=unclassified Novosphingobium TaxID=2644732 RepID=UPI001066334B|nr:fumarylacetoacetate hydrolase family protein [Novosphingobium sp. PhB55]TDW64337.1 2-keto-4-pentenoate hydratase/2-oxohepta-3-ene-1,7-dioic acid hydratase in catechol pathway [Novosphingobium sp. PhB55]